MIEQQWSWDRDTTMSTDEANKLGESAASDLCELGADELIQPELSVTAGAGRLVGHGFCFVWTIIERVVCLFSMEQQRMVLVSSRTVCVFPTIFRGFLL